MNNYEIEQDGEYCNEKLIIAADDIKEMKNDSSKFSKTTHFYLMF